MDENKIPEQPAGSPAGDPEDVADSATPGKKPIDETSESSKERREHPGLAEGQQNER
jgi:hypothetical protein